jgi:predicted metalloendopeptidase
MFFLKNISIKSRTHCNIYFKGRQYDKDGNLRQWWTEDVIQNFKKQAQCLVDQYGNFSVPEADGMNVSGHVQSYF